MKSFNAIDVQRATIAGFDHQYGRVFIEWTNRNLDTCRWGIWRRAQIDIVSFRSAKFGSFVDFTWHDGEIDAAWVVK